MTSRLRLTLGVVVGLVVVTALRLPVLGAGFAMDDYAQLAMLGGVYPAERAPWDLFTFSTGDPSEVRDLMARGSLAWWSAPDLRLSGLRPLSSLLTAADVWWFGQRPFWPHVHTLLWWLALIGAVFWLLDGILSRRTAALATLIYALDEGHVFPLAWLCNRNVLIAAVFGVVGLKAHLRWRRDGWRPGLGVSLLAFTLSLAAGEYALACLAYVLAYEVLGTRDRWVRRIQALAPVSVLTVVYVVVHRLLGFGSRSSGVYFDPLREPMAYFEALLLRAPVLIGDLFLAIPTAQVAFLPEWHVFLAVVGLAGLGLVLILLGATRPAGDESIQHARWLLGGALVGLLPLCASFASTRLLVIPAIGGQALIAMVLVAAYEQRRRLDDFGWSQRLVMALSLVLAALHLLLAPWWSIREQRAIVEFNNGCIAAVRASPIQDPAIEDQRLVVLTAIDPYTLLYPPFIQWVDGGPLPKSWWVLSMAPGRHRLTRVDGQTLELEALDSAMLRGPVERMFRREDSPLRTGDRIDLSGLSVTVMKVESKGPRSVRFRFSEPADGPDYRFLITTAGALRRYPLPPVGGSVVLAPAALLHRSADRKPTR